MSTSTITDRLHGIDSLRGWAACGVVILHAYFIHPIVMSEKIETLIGFLGMGVPLFFVISAFSLAYAYSNRLDSVNAITNYAFRRFFRIAPLFYVMLIAWSYYLSTHGSPLKSNFEYMLNITFLFGLVPEMQVSIVPAGWSIGVEALFYLVFPLMIIAIKKLSHTLLLLVLSLILAYYINLPRSEVPDYYYWTNIFTNGPYFIFGIIAYQIFLIVPENLHKYVAKYCVIIGCIMLLSLMVWGLISSIETDPKTTPASLIGIFGWGFAFSLIVLSQALFPARLLCNRFSIFLGAISYSLYLVHPLIIYSSPVIKSINASSWALTSKFIVTGSLSLIASIIIGWILYKIVEKTGIKIGRYSTRRFSIPTQNS